MDPTGQINKAYETECFYTATLMDIVYCLIQVYISASRQYVIRLFHSNGYILSRQGLKELTSKPDH
jgi:hypothetical protein